MVFPLISTVMELSMGQISLNTPSARSWIPCRATSPTAPKRKQKPESSFLPWWRGKPFCQASPVTWCPSFPEALLSIFRHNSWQKKINIGSPDEPKILKTQFAWTKFKDGKDWGWDDNIFHNGVSTRHETVFSGLLGRITFLGKPSDSPFTGSLVGFFKKLCACQHME